MDCVHPSQDMRHFGPTKKDTLINWKGRFRIWSVTCDRSDFLYYVFRTFLSLNVVVFMQLLLWVEPELESRIEKKSAPLCNFFLSRYRSLSVLRYFSMFFR